MDKHVDHAMDAYLAGTLPPSRQADVTAHVRACPRCAEALAALKRAHACLSSLPAPELSADFVDRVCTRVDREPARRVPSIARLRAVATTTAAVVLICGGGLILIQYTAPWRRPRAAAVPIVVPSPGPEPAPTTPLAPVPGPTPTPSTPPAHQVSPPASPAPVLLLASAAQTESGVIARGQEAAGHALALDPREIDRLVEALATKIQVRSALAARLAREGVQVAPVTLKGLDSPTAAEALNARLATVLAARGVRTSPRGPEARLTLARTADGLRGTLAVVAGGKTLVQVDHVPAVAAALPQTLGHADTVRWLIARLGNSDSGAAEALVTAGPAATPALLQVVATDSDREARLSAAWVLGRTKDPSAIAPLIALLAGDRADAALNALRAYGARALDAVLDTLAREQGPRTRAHLVALLDGIDHPRAAAALAGALGDADPLVRQTAAFALAGRKDPRAVNGLCALLTDPSADVRLRAAEALRPYAAPAAVAPLRAVLLGDTDDVVRRAAVATLRDTCDARAAEALVAALRDPALQHDAHERLLEDTVEALTRQGAEAVPALLGALRDENTGVRRMAAWALGEIRDARAVGPLTEARHDPDPAVRAAATEALRRLAAVGRP